jgi:hypothetical protein
VYDATIASWAEKIRHNGERLFGAQGCHCTMLLAVQQLPPVPLLMRVVPVSGAVCLGGSASAGRYVLASSCDCCAVVCLRPQLSVRCHS